MCEPLRRDGSRRSDSCRSQLLHDRYVIEKQIGKGGMAEVFLVYDERLQKNWAMKRIRKKCYEANEEGLLASFHKEIHILSTLQHAGIPRITDQFEDTFYYYVIMDYIAGKSLAQELEDENNIEEKEICFYMQQIIDIFTYLHTLQPYPLLYLDLKPQNILINEQKRLYLIDFGTSCYMDGKQKTWSATPRLCAKGGVSGKGTCNHKRYL